MFFSRPDDPGSPKRGALNALCAFIYVVAVALFMSAAENLFGEREPDLLAPIGFLMLFVLSAAVMGMLIFGAPVMLYIDGKKKEAVRLLVWTVGSFAAITVCVLSVLALSAL
jgi:hypothetical protein